MEYGTLNPEFSTILHDLLGHGLDTAKICMLEKQTGKRWLTHRLGTGAFPSDHLQRKREQLKAFVKPVGGNRQPIRKRIRQWCVEKWFPGRVGPDCLLVLDGSKKAN